MASVRRGEDAYARYRGRSHLPVHCSRQFCDANAFDAVKTNYVNGKFQLENSRSSNTRTRTCTCVTLL